MKKILLPTDFSDNAWNAIFTVTKLYANVPCTFYLLHAYEPDAFNMLGRKGQQRLGIIYDSLSEFSKNELKKIITYLRKNHHNPKHNYDVIAKPGTTEETVEQVLLQKDIDLICMGTQGATGAKQVFMGNTTVKVLKTINDCPILAVPDDYNFQSLKSLVFSTDFSKKYKKYQLAPLTELAFLWETKIQVAHVAIAFDINDQQLANKALLIKHFSKIKTTFINIDFEAKVEHSLKKFMDNAHVDMMALIQYNHSFWEKIINEPVVKKMTFHTKVPLLILPE